MTSKLKDIKHYATRNLRVHNIQSFNFWLDFLRMFQSNERTYNFYYSMARFEVGVPYRNTKEGNLKEDFSEWNDNAKKEIVSYDMPIDIDAGDFSELDYAKESARNIKVAFDCLNIPYHLRYSGMGFHFIIPYKYFPQDLSLNPDKCGNIYQYMKRLAKRFHNEYSEMVDTTIYDSRRFLKIPMSLSIYDSGVFQCVPVKDIDNFDYLDYEINNFKKIGIIDDVLHNENGNLDGFDNG